MRQKTWILAVIVLAAGAFAPEQSEAGTYQVKSCASDAARFSTQAYGQAATRGMKVRRACNPRGPGVRGLLVGNLVRRSRVERFARATVQITAPPGTRFRSFEWSGQIRRTDCRYAMQLYAVVPGGRLKSLRNFRAYRHCPRKGRAQLLAATSRTVKEPTPGATRIVQRIVCQAEPGKRCSSRRANYIKLRAAEASIEDYTPPSVQILGGSLFEGWVSGERTVEYSATDNVGVRFGRLFSSGQFRGEKPRGCNDSLPVPCPNGPDRLGVRGATLPEGSQQVTVQAEDSAGIVGESPPVVAHVDNTPPTAVPLNVDGGDAWRATNGFSARWVNPAEPDRAPIDAAAYRVCRGGGSCEDPKTAVGPNISELSGLQVPAPVEWTLRMWRRDAAGNSDESNASAPVTLRYDPEAPKLAFSPITPTDPALVTAPTSDPLSGVASGQIEISREGSGSWQGLATNLNGDRLEARIDDAALPPGRYLLRAGATDRAGNRGATETRSDGSVAAVTLPLRLEAVLSAGFVRTKVVRRVVKGKGRRKVVRRRVSRLVDKARVRRGRRAAISGRLETRDGRALANTIVYVFAGGASQRYLGTATTDAAGRYRYIIRASSSSTLRLVYLGAPAIRPAVKEVELEVPAQSSFKVNHRRLVNGQRAVFGGRLAVPPKGLATGKLVELQTRLSGRWQTFRTVRTDSAGRWRSAYRFRRTRGLVRYRFRARLPREAAYPFATGKTRSLGVTVRGR